MARLERLVVLPIPRLARLPVQLVRSCRRADFLLSCCNSLVLVSEIRRLEYVSIQSGFLVSPTLLPFAPRRPRPSF